MGMHLWVSQECILMKIFDCLSVGFLLALSLNMVIVFFLAFFNGEGVCIVHVNDFHEANAEAIIFPIWFIMGSITFVRMIRKLR